MKTNFENTKNKIIQLLNHYDIKRASLFGSFARGDVHKNSDVDILAEFKGKKSLLDLAGLKIALEKLLRRKVDVLTYNSLLPLLKDRILNEQKIIL